MGKLLKWISPLVIVAIICTLLILPLCTGGEEASANSYPWADLYGFEYYPSYNTYYHKWSYSWYHGSWIIFSGTEQRFEPSYPSTHYTLCYRGWPSTYYNNYGADTAVGNLPGNAYFYFFGNAYRERGHDLQFKDRWGNYSYLLDVPRPGDPEIYGTRYYVTYLRSMDDMLFAMLNACTTARNFWGDGRHLTWEFRCDRGVDIVVGFTDKTKFDETGYWGNPPELVTHSQSHIWNTEFGRASQIYGYSVINACNFALEWTRYHCNGRDGNHDSCQVWGYLNDQINWPHDGRYEGRP